jgi:hypothetical protein
MQRVTAFGGRNSRWSAYHGAQAATRFAASVRGIGEPARSSPPALRKGSPAAKRTSIVHLAGSHLRCDASVARNLTVSPQAGTVALSRAAFLDSGEWKHREWGGDGEPTAGADVVHGVLVDAGKKLLSPRPKRGRSGRRPASGRGTVVMPPASRGASKHEAAMMPTKATVSPTGARVTAAGLPELHSCTQPKASEVQPGGEPRAARLRTLGPNSFNSTEAGNRHRSVPGPVTWLWGQSHP